MQLDGKTAIVTGGAGGIGAEIVRAFAREGASVCIADLDLEAAQRLADAVGGASRAIAVRMDVTDEFDVQRGVDAAAAKLGGIDILVSNAGIQRLDEIVDVSFANWRRMLAVHLDGAFLTARACLRHMYARKRGGTILLTGSVHSKEASVKKGPYVVAKHGLLGLCRVIAKEGARHGVRANVICPGFVRTPMIERQIPELAATMGINERDVVQNVMLKTTVDGKFTTVADIAATAVFLAAFPTNALTGQSIVVSHGWHME
jgi:3-hydroxybutyrate dehydrogenase